MHNCSVFSKSILNSKTLSKDADNPYIHAARTKNYNNMIYMLCHNRYEGFAEFNKRTNMQINIPIDSISKMFKKVPYIKYFQGINFKNYLNGNIHDIYFQFPGTWVSVAKVTYNDYICTDFIYTHNTKGYLVYVNAFKKYPYDTLHINSSKDIIFHFQKLKDVTKIVNENGYKECLKLKDNVIALLNSLEPILDVEQNEKKKFSF